MILNRILHSWSRLESVQKIFFPQNSGLLVTLIYLQTESFIHFILSKKILSVSDTKMFIIGCMNNKKNKWTASSLTRGHFI